MPRAARRLSLPLHLARAIRATLRDNLLEPLIVLLSHPWFGAEEELPAIPALRGLFVQYSRQIRPALGDVCERWESLNAGQFSLEPLVSVLR